jgi:hypothetical protein
VLPVLAAYLAISVWVQWGALTADVPSLLIPFGGTGFDFGNQLDQNMTLAIIAQNAAHLLSEPTSLLGLGQCFPLRGAYVLGEHMLGISLMTAPGVAAGLDPAVSLNLALVANRFIAAVGMFLLARRVVADVPGAFVAGILFGFGYLRVTDPVHPFVWGDHWTPFAMLFLDRLVLDRDGAIRNAIGLTLSVVLMIGESFYSLLAGAIVGTVWLGLTFWQAGPRVRERLPLLLAAALLPLVVGAVLLLPYLHASDLTAAPPGRPLPFGISFLLPGHRFFPGFLPLVLATIGLLVRRPLTAAGRVDPRWPLAVTAAFVAFAAIDGVTVPGTAWHVPSPLVVARNWIPGLSAVRAPFCILSATYLCLALLSAFGVKALGVLVPRPLRAAAAVAIALLWIAELYVPLLADPSFGRQVDLTPHAYALGANDEGLVAAVDGPVADYPPGYRQRFGDSFVLAAHHRQPFATCYNSRAPTTRDSIDALLGRVPSDAALDALSAAGFENLIVHAHDLGAVEAAVLPTLEQSDRVELVTRSPEHVLFRLRPSTSPPLGFEAIAGAPVTCAIVPDRDKLPAVSVQVSNGATGTFRHPDPLRRVPVEIEWRDRGGRTIRTLREDLSLPVALEPGASQSIRPLLVPPDAPGPYVLDLTLVGPPPRRIGSCTVEVRPTPHGAQSRRP